MGCENIRMDSEGLCRYKLVTDDGVFCMCKDLKILKCLDEENQLRLFKLRWNRVRKSRND